MEEKRSTEEIILALGGKLVGEAKDWEDGPFDVAKLAKALEKRDHSVPLPVIPEIEEQREGTRCSITLIVDPSFVDQLVVLANEASVPRVHNKVTIEQMFIALAEEATNRRFPAKNE